MINVENNHRSGKIRSAVGHADAILTLISFPAMSMRNFYTLPSSKFAIYHATEFCNHFIFYLHFEDTSSFTSCNTRITLFTQKESPACSS